MIRSKSLKGISQGERTLERARSKKKYVRLEETHNSRSKDYESQGHNSNRRPRPKHNTQEKRILTPIDLIDTMLYR